MTRVPHGALRISANEHGCRLVRCDYIAALDDIDAQTAPWGAPRVASYAWAEHQLKGAPFPIANSGCLATWLAYMMGCSPILIAGVDLYRTGYFHNPAPIPKPTSEVSRLQEWARLRDAIPEAKVFTMSGPLDTVFPRWVDT